MRCQSCLETRLWSDPDRLQGMCYFPIFPGCWLSISNDGNFFAMLVGSKHGGTSYVLVWNLHLTTAPLSLTRDYVGWAENDRGVSYVFGTAAVLVQVTVLVVPDFRREREHSRKCRTDLLLVPSPCPEQSNWLAIRTDVVAAFLKRYNLDLVCRAHQVVEDGQTLHACCPRNGWSIGPWRDALQIHDWPGSFWIQMHQKASCQVWILWKTPVGPDPRITWTLDQSPWWPYATATLNPVLRKVRER